MKKPAAKSTAAPKAKAKAPAAKKSEESSMIFADLIQAKMLEAEKAHLRDVKVTGQTVVYEFSNGEQVTVDKTELPSDYTSIQQHVAERFADRKPT